jgi:hypothetical protein
MDATEKRLLQLQAINQRNIDDYFADGKALNNDEVTALIECHNRHGREPLDVSRLENLQHFLKVINPSSVAAV